MFLPSQRSSADSNDTDSEFGVCFSGRDCFRLPSVNSERASLQWVVATTFELTPVAAGLESECGVQLELGTAESLLSDVDRRLEQRLPGRDNDAERRRNIGNFDDFVDL